MRIALSFLLSFIAALATMVPLDISIEAYLTLTVGLSAFAAMLLYSEPMSFKGAAVVVSAIVLLQAHVYFDAVSRAVALMT